MVFLEGAGIFILLFLLLAGLAFSLDGDDGEWVDPPDSL